MIRIKFRTDGFDVTKTQKYANNVGDATVTSFSKVFDFFRSHANTATLTHEVYVRVSSALQQRVRGFIARGWSTICFSVK